MQRKRLVKVLIIIAMCLIPIACVLFVPKRPFFWLNENHVESIEYRYDYDLTTLEPRYVQLDTEDLQKVIQNLREVKVTVFCDTESVSRKVGGIMNPYRITLNSGRTLCLVDVGEDICVIFLKGGEHIGATQYQDISLSWIILRFADDSDTYSNRIDIKGVLGKYSNEYGWPTFD